MGKPIVIIRSLKRPTPESILKQRRGIDQMQIPKTKERERGRKIHPSNLKKKKEKNLQPSASVVITGYFKPTQSKNTAKNSEIPDIKNRGHRRRQQPNLEYLATGRGRGPHAAAAGTAPAAAQRGNVSDGCPLHQRHGSACRNRHRIGRRPLQRHRRRRRRRVVCSRGGTEHVAAGHIQVYLSMKRYNLLFYPDRRLFFLKKKEFSTSPYTATFSQLQSVRWLLSPFRRCYL